MKKVKIKICGYDPNASQFTYGKFLLGYLRRNYEIELSNQPDYIFFHERDTEHLNYPKAVRIFYTGENVSPDFNVCDYAISFDQLSFGDRHFRLPLYMVATLYDQTDIDAADDLTFEKTVPMTMDELQSKKYFCSFVYSNAMADPRRTELFNTLNTYKSVRSGGKFLNNIGGPVAHKLLFEREHKFSIAFENSSRHGYITEKLPAALAARTIPIYFGAPDVGEYFNTKRFINIHELGEISAVLERIKEIDRDDDLYLSIANQPILTKSGHYTGTLTAFNKFLNSIFDQPLALANRRTINAAHSQKIEQRDKLFYYYQKTTGIINKSIRPLKKIPGIKNVLQKIKRHSLHL